MKKISLKDITSDDYPYIKLRTRLILPSEQARYIAEVVYDDGWGMPHILTRSISSILSEAVNDAITTSGMLFLRGSK